MDKRPFHFHTLGYHKNPFGALSDEEWAAIAILPKSVTAVLPNNFIHLQLLGPKGCGKTTTLRKIMAAFQQPNLHTAYEYIPEGATQFKTNLTDLDLFCLDEAQRLTYWERRRWLNQVQNGRLRAIFSSHKDLSKSFQRRKLPLQTIHINQEIDEAHYKAVLYQRLAYFSLPNQPTIQLADSGIAFLYETFGQDMREAEYFLYEVWQEQTQVNVLTAVDLQQIHHQLHP